jgi:hypothetical protein
MTYRHFKYEGWLYILAFLTAVALRFIQLGAMPLTDLEAAPALQALHIAQGLRPALSPHPFYILFTSIFFFLYGGGTNFLARLIPALIGSLLVFAPLLFINRIKPRPSLFLAFFIALDPGLVSLSRQAASPILAIAFLLFAWGFLEQKKYTLAGIFAAFALLGGPSIWLGILGLAITWAILQGLNFRRTPEIPAEPSPAFRLPPSVLSSFIVAFIIAGTLFFIVPNGISAALASIPAFFGGWVSTSDVPAIRLLISLVVYQLLGVLLALFAIIRGWRNGSPRIISLSVWFLVALLLVVFIPSRQIADLAWALIPLWAMASLELVRNVDIFPEERNEVMGVVFLTAFIWAFTWLDFSGMVWSPVDSSQYSLRFWLLIGAVFLFILSLLLVAAGWSIRVARIGGVWGLTIVLSIFGLAGALGSAGFRGSANPELWWLPFNPVQADLLQATVQDISDWGVGNKFSAPVVIAGLDSPALEWALRQHSVLVVDALDISSSPDFVITPFENDPVLVAAYRGQDFSWRQTPSWNATLPNDWIRWVALREMPQTGETIILWVRDDLFIDAPAQASP